MTLPSDLPKSRAYQAKHLLARLTLIWEAFWTASAPAMAIVVAAVAAGLLEIPQSFGAWFGGPLGGWMHVALLAAALGGLGWCTRLAVLRFQAPDDHQVKRRLEEASGLRHRPLTALTDRLANGADPRSRRLWNAFLRRTQAMQAQLTVGPPRPILPRLDPFAIRSGLGLALIVALVVGWEDPGARLMAAIKPSFDAAGGPRTATVDMWISPPAYTGKPPLLLTRRPLASAVSAKGGSQAGADRQPAEAAAIPVPIGSKVLAAVSGGAGIPELLVETGASASAPDIHPFEAIGGESYRLEMVLEAGVGLTIRQDGDTLSQWQLNGIPDLAPEISFAKLPSGSQRGSLVIQYEARDDYGISSASAVIRRLTSDGSIGNDSPLILQMPLPGLGKTTATGKSFNELTPHAFAGHLVRIVMQTTDEIGQIGKSEPVEMILPERIFRHPVARAVIEQRKRLVSKPEERRDIAGVIMTIAARPQHYADDLVVFLNLKSAAARLSLNEDGGQDGSVVSLLWDTALRIEDGELSIAARQLRELERQLQDALAGDASDEQIEQLMDQLKEAIDKYLEAMAKQQQNQTGQQQQGEGQQAEGDDAMRRQDLQEMLEKMREMAQSGARDSAREMLSRLQEMMENLRMGNQQMSPQQRATQEMMRQLSELSRQQQQLMDDTYKQHQKGDRQGKNGRDGSNEWGRMGGQRLQQPPRFGEGMPRQRQQGSPQSGPRRQGQNRQGQNRQGQNGMTDGQLAEAQERLRRQLGEIMRKLSESFNQIPDG
ncbi:MAG: TIGR02302 family protein, partial [Proteobacteria bacterium]|nr:TIGR02302 family protein [Pseudomonadota bacterium]